jgi:hypothetical protein
VPVSHNTHKFSDDHFHIDLSYGFITNQSPKHQVAQGESNEFLLVSQQELKKLDAKVMPPGIKEVGLFIFEKCLKRWEKVDPKEFDD